MHIFKKTDALLSHEEIHAWLLELRGHPYVPASGYEVMAAFRADIAGEGYYYFAGVNVENPDHRLSTHGEEGAIAALTVALGRHARIAEGWVMGAPVGVEPGSGNPLADTLASCCGKCRQQLINLASEDAVFHMLSLNGAVADIPAAGLLAEPFTFRYYAPAVAAEWEARGHIPAPTAEAIEARLMRRAPLSETEIFAWLQSLDAFDYATKVSQSVVVRLENGVYVAGTTVEEAAFVSINPIQSAMAVAAGEFGAARVREVWVHSRGRDGQKLDEYLCPPLSLSAIQSLAQFATGEADIHIFNARGESLDMKLCDAARHIPVFDGPEQGRDR